MTRRIVLLAILLVLAAAFAPGAAAAGSRPSSGHRATPVTNPRVLRIKWGLWPTGSYVEAGSLVGPAWADDPKQNLVNQMLFVGAVPAYARHGMLGGYTQSAGIPLGSNVAGAIGYYLGSYFDSASHAASFVSDTEIFLGAYENIREKHCGHAIVWPDDCHWFVVSWSAHSVPYVTYYMIFSKANVVMEVALEASTSNAEAITRPTFTETASLLEHAALQTLYAAVGPPPPPPPPAVTIPGAGRLTTFKGHYATLPNVTLAKTFFFAVRYREANVTSTRRTGDAWLRKGKLHIHLDLVPGILKDGTRTLGSSYVFVDKAWIGTVAATYTVTIGSITKTGNVDLSCWGS